MEAQAPEKFGPSVNRDFISKLPDSILIYILSLLPMKEAIRTSILSKTWKSIWIALPYLILDVDCRAEFCSSQKKKKTSNHGFFGMVNKIILNRCKQQTTILQKFHLVIPDTTGIFESRERFQTKLNTWVSQMPYIEELELDFRYCSYLGKYAIPSTLLLAKSLRVLSLSGLNLVPLSNFCINFTSLRTMHLEDALLDDNLVQQLILGCPLLEDLSLVGCYGLKIIHVTGLVQLKGITVCDKFGMNELQIDSLGMTELQIDSPGLVNLKIFSTHRQFKVNIETCACLRKVELFGDFITDEWLSCLVSRCAFLEDLNIGYSEALENLKITTNTLKMLTLNASDELVEVEINAPRLEKFIFRLEESSLRWIHTCLLNASHTLEVRLILESSGIWDQYYDELTNFLAYFNHFRAIELCGLLDTMIIPKENRDNLVSPLYEMKHLVLFVRGIIMDFPSVELLEYMLWLCPQAESLWIKAGTSRDNVWLSLRPRIKAGTSRDNVELEIVLKFLYEDNVCKDSSFPCCKSLPVKCWWHRLVEARVEKLVGLVDTENMKNFFLRHGKNLIL